jgi:hypothetical protein
MSAASTCGATSRTAGTATSFTAPQLRGLDEPTLLVALTGPVTTLGRGEDNDVVLSDTSVSRCHARIVRTAEGFRIEDLDSFNGTAVGGVDLHGGPVTYRWLRADGQDSGELVRTAHRGEHRVRVHLRWTVRGPGRFRGAPA